MLLRGLIASVLSGATIFLSTCKSRAPQSSSKNITVESADGTNVMLVYKDPENSSRLGIRQCAELTVLEDLPKDTSPKEAISKQLTACGGSGKDSWSGTPQVFMGKMLEAIKTVEPDSNDQELLAAINQVKTFDPNQHKNLSASDLKLKESRQKLEVELLRARRFAKGLEVTEPQGKILSDKIKGLETEIAKFDAEIKSLQEKIKSADPAQLTAAEETIETRLTNIMENVILATTTVRYNPIGKDKYGYRVLAKVLGDLIPGGIGSKTDSMASQSNSGYPNSFTSSRTYVSPAKMPATVAKVTVKAVFEIGSNIMYWQTRPLLLSNGTMVMGSGNHKIYWVKDGEKLAEFETGDSVNSSPAVLNDGTVVVGSGDKKIYWLKRDAGNLIKMAEFQTGGPVHSSPAVLSDGTVVVGSSDNKIYWLKPE